METVDLVRSLGALYKPPRDRFVVVEVPELQYLAVDGEGDPNLAPAYRQAVEALYSTSYALKFAARTALGRDHKVGPLEALWWSDDPGTFVRRDKSAWRWTVLILQPDWVDAELVATVAGDLGRKKDLPALPRLGLRTLAEGTSAQRLHVGPYDDEGPLLDELHHVWMPEHGWTFGGPHHEIYLGDPRRTAPERLRTILRQPLTAV